MEATLPISPEHTLRRFVTLDLNPHPSWVQWQGSIEVDRDLVIGHIHSAEAHALIFESMLFEPSAQPVGMFGDVLASPSSVPDGSMVFLSAALTSSLGEYLSTTPDAGTFNRSKRVRGMLGALGVWRLPDGREVAIVATPELRRGLVAIMSPETPSEVTLPTYSVSKGSKPSTALIKMQAYTGARHILYTAWEGA